MVARKLEKKGGRCTVPVNCTLRCLVSNVANTRAHRAHKPAEGEPARKHCTIAKSKSPSHHKEEGKREQAHIEYNTSKSEELPPTNCQMAPHTVAFALFPLLPLLRFVRHVVTFAVPEDDMDVQTREQRR